MAKKKVVEPFTPFAETNKIKKVKLLVAIVNRGQGEFFTNLFKKNESAISLTLLGHGTASSEISDMLGVGETSKDIVLGLIREEMLPAVLTDINARFAVSRKAKGVAFTIPLTSVIGVSIYKFLTNSTGVNGGK
ncbi:MAG: hypothetical protein NTV44_04125 [Firmicutes bacterium]|nr:hypothetical protein [Bacillota bacterium]